MANVHGWTDDKMHAWRAALTTPRGQRYRGDCRCSYCDRYRAEFEEAWQVHTLGLAQDQTCLTPEQIAAATGEGA